MAWLRSCSRAPLSQAASALERVSQAWGLPARRKRLAVISAVTWHCERFGICHLYIDLPAGGWVAGGDAGRDRPEVQPPVSQQPRHALHAPAQRRLCHSCRLWTRSCPSTRHVSTLGRKHACLIPGTRAARGNRQHQHLMQLHETAFIEKPTSGSKHSGGNTPPSLRHHRRLLCCSDPRRRQQHCAGVPCPPATPAYTRPLATARQRVTS